MSVTVKRFSDPEKKVHFWKNLKSLPLTEKILGPIALLVVLGWLIRGSGFSERFLTEWFATASFLAALAIAALIVLKLFGKRPLTEQTERYSIAVVSLLPIVGFLVTSLRSVPYFLTVGGSMALAYVSASVYWRKHIPDLGETLGESEAQGAGTEPEAAGDPATQEGAEAADPEKPEPSSPTSE
jgi:hypothetical protein